MGLFPGQGCAEGVDKIYATQLYHCQTSKEGGVFQGSFHSAQRHWGPVFPTRHAPMSAVPGSLFMCHNGAGYRK